MSEAARQPTPLDGQALEGQVPVPPPSKPLNAEANLQSALMSARGGGEAKRVDMNTFETSLARFLDATGWTGDAAHLLDVLPYIDPICDLDGLAETLGRLGYDATVVTCAREDLTARHFPVIALVKGTPEVLLTAAELARIQRFRRRVTLCLCPPNTTDTLVRVQRSRSWMADALFEHRDAIFGALLITFATNLFAVATPLFAVAIYNMVIPSDGLTTLAYVAALIVVSFAAEDQLRRLRARLIAQTGTKIHEALMAQGVAKVVSLPLGDIEGVSTAQQLAQLKRLENIASFLQGGSFAALLDVPFVGVFLVMLWVLGGPLAIVPTVAIVIFLGLATLSVLTSRFAEERSKSARRLSREIESETAQKASAIRAAGVEDLWLERLQDILTQDADLNVKQSTRMHMVSHLGHAVISATTPVLLCIGALMILAGNLSVGVLVAATMLSTRALSPMQALYAAVGQLRSLREDAAMIDRLFLLSETQESAKFPRVDRKFAGHLRVQRVGYRFPDSPDFALRDINFELQTGSIMGLVGPEGSGKSTLLKLMLGLTQPTLGSITLDGMLFSQLEQAELRRSFAFVSHTPELFYGTVAQNIQLGRPNVAHFEMEEMLDALNLPLGDERFPEGLQTRLTDTVRRRVGTDALQKICIARAILSDRSILAFEDVFGQLDREALSALIARLSTLKRERSILVCSTNRRVLEACDTLLALNKGCAVAMGPSQDVLKQITKR